MLDEARVWTTLNTMPAPARAPVGLAIELDNDVGKALQCQKGQRFYLNRIDLRMSVDTTQDDGVSTGLARPRVSRVTRTSREADCKLSALSTKLTGPASSLVSSRNRALSGPGWGAAAVAPARWRCSRWQGVGDRMGAAVGMLPDLLLGGGLRARCRRTPFDGPSERCYTGV
jgi:hypothetical protein